MKPGEALEPRAWTPGAGGDQGKRPTRDVTSIATQRFCAWCRGPIRRAARRDSKYCSTRCRQAAHRFHAGAQRRVASSSPLRLAYADPPYPGLAGYYRDHPDFAGEVDHTELVERLVAEFPDGWALSTSARALRDVLASCPPAATQRPSGENTDQRTKRPGEPAKSVAFLSRNE